MKALKYILYSLGLFVLGMTVSSVVYYLKYKESFITKYQNLRQNRLYVPGVEGQIDFSWHINKFIMPGVGFLSDIIIFNVAVFALLIPLSYMVMDRADNKYGTSKVSEVFFSIWEAKLLPFLLAFSVLYCVILKFFIREQPVSDIWTVSAWIALIIFAFILWTSLSFLIKMRLFVSDAGFALDRLLSEAWDCVLKTKAKNRFALFAETLQSIGEMLSREVKVHNSKNLAKTLSELQQIASHLLKLNTDDVPTVGDAAVTSDSDKSSANFQRILLLPLEQVAKIHAEAALCSNSAVSAIVERSAVGIFSDISCSKQNTDLIRDCIEIFFEMSGKSQTPETVFLWFTEAVFRKDDFSYEYLDILNRSLAKSLKNALLKGSQESIAAFFNELQKLPAPAPFSFEIYNQTLIELNRKKYIEMSDELSVYSSLEDLQRKAIEITTINMLDEWSESFTAFHQKVSSYYKKDKFRRIDEIKSVILENVRAALKGIYVSRIIFNLLAYSIFTENRALLKIIWKALADKSASLSGLITTGFEPEYIVKMYIDGDFHTDGTVFIDDSDLWHRAARISLLLILVKMADNRHLMKTDSVNIKLAHPEKSCEQTDTLIEAGKALMSGSLPVLSIIENSDLIPDILQNDVIPFLISIKHSLKERAVSR
ncbi:hypothetical protein [Candidatus Magnetomonas plexicatena]|uniref:hypothetical protein n=1 Tax=Candidatus Magnetomonas plexicatena TaxID=2552947 RepID=UPI001C765736|nr:hypothetical protein E2O03_004115 [Nitrospirales bacterium LBB_01]